MLFRRRQGREKSDMYTLGMSQIYRAKLTNEISHDYCFSKPKRIFPGTRDKRKGEGSYIGYTLFQEVQ